ncbi:MAG TPA: S24 family peptidase [Thermoanaerobaculia bacterium]|nr:S24 family peptidase [Thermoanaerobaculia bacterium]
MAPHDYIDDMRRLRAVIERRITEFGVRHRRRFTTDSNTSKILNERQNPGLFTVRDLATKLDTTVGDLLEEPVLGEADLKKLRELVDFLIARFDLMGARAAASREEKTFVIREAEFVERDYDYPRPHHVFLVPRSKAAAGRGIESDWEGEMTEVLHSIRDVYNGELRVIRVIGESMTPVLRSGDKIVVDTRRTTPQEGEVVAVYDHTLGGILGYWTRSARGFRIEKDNRSAQPIDLDPAGSWTLWGTATRIVDTPIARRRI